MTGYLKWILKLKLGFGRCGDDPCRSGKRHRHCQLRLPEGSDGLKIRFRRRHAGLAGVHGEILSRRRSEGWRQRDRDGPDADHGASSETVRQRFFAPEPDETGDQPEGLRQSGGSAGAEDQHQPNELSSAAGTTVTALERQKVGTVRRHHRRRNRLGLVGLWTNC